MNVGEAIDKVSDLLESGEVAEPRRESGLLVSFAIGQDRTFLRAHPEYELTDDEKTRLTDFARRRANREPFQYISGKQEFFGLEFEVTPAVLIPRPETEMLVERAIEVLSIPNTPAEFLEIGVGSGCIAISILHNVKTARAVGVDLSEDALAVARKNALKHEIANRLDLLLSDVYSSITPKTFDAIVSNPPYVPSSDVETLQAEVRDFEPLAALTDGHDGLSIIARIIKGARKFLKPGGNLLIEIGFDQSARVEKMFDPLTWHAPNLIPDLQGIPRIVHARDRSK
jgi:release factor glutamine methyltransferase